MTRIQKFDLDEITIPKKMKKAKPKLYKIMGMEAFYKKYKTFYGSVILSKNYELLDGYVVYYTAKKMKIKQVPVVILNTLKDYTRFKLKKTL